MNPKHKTLSLVLISFLLTVHLVGCSSREDAAIDGRAGSPSAIGVDDAVRNLKPDKTAQAVVGVVQTVTPDDHILTLIDTTEYKVCGLSKCCLYMPVKWNGTMPNIKDVVTVKGTIESTESGMIFSADELLVSKAGETQ